ncbi:MAG: CvpA family protein [Bacilli bacterium]|nr:CvpA family protein [Bacilli bacterium]
MIIGVVDLLIILFVLLGGVVGYKNGFITEGIHFIGIILISVIAFILKDSLMVIMYENLPFFNFFGIIKGISAINVLFYQLLSFLIIFGALFFLLRVLLVITGFVEWLVKLTVFLKISSKILGVLVGILEFYVYVFIVLYILNMPIFNLHYVADSKYGNTVLQETPILSGLVDNTVDAYNDVWVIIRNRDKNSDKEVNTLVLATLLDHNLLTIDSARKLVEANKIDITDDSMLDNYSDNNNFYSYVRDKIPVSN